MQKVVPMLHRDAEQEEDSGSQNVQHHQPLKLLIVALLMLDCFFGTLEEYKHQDW